MATLYLPSSGGYSSSTYVRYRIEVIEGAISGRTRSITVNVKYWRTNTGYTTYGSGTCYCTINGTTYSQAITSSQKITYNSYTTLFSKTLSVSYDNYGAKSLAITAYSSTDVANMNSSAQGGTLALSNIGPVTYAVTYNANGGTGAPGSQIKTYGTALTLSSTTPTRAGYNFLGWSASSTATSATYMAGGSYTSNASVTLYAVWSVAYVKPRINNLTIYRCTSSGGTSDTGTYFTVDFDWATDTTVSSVVVKWKTSSATSWSSSTMSASGTSGSVLSVLGSGAISVESTYTVMVTVTDASGSSSKSGTVSGKVYPIDFLSGGTGVAFGKPAETTSILDSNWPIYEQGKSLSAKYAPTCGTSGIWRYVKWPNGRVELEGAYSISNLACTTALGAWYRTNVFTPSAFPFTVTSPRLVANYESDGYGAVLWATTTTTTSSPPSYYLIRPTSATIESGKIIFHVTGTWS